MFSVAYPHRPGPILVVMTVRTESLAEAHEASALLERLDLPRVEVPPLAVVDHERLVRQLLGLGGDLANKVCERTGGNPLFAVQLVGDWVERGILQLKADGFAVRPGADIALPDDLHAVWRARVGRVVERAGGGRDALMLAALLGANVDGTEWSAACVEAKVEVPNTLVDTLLRERLAVETDTGWRFVHGMLCESLQRLVAVPTSSPEPLRRERFHAACAVALQADETPVGLQRRGHHLAESGALRHALDVTVSAMRAWHGQAEWRRAERLEERFEQLADLLGLDDDAPMRSALHHGRANRMEQLGDYEGARREAVAIIDRRDIEGWHRAVPHAERVLGYCAKQTGDLAAARAGYERALTGFRAQGDLAAAALAAASLSTLALLAGELDQAWELVDEALRCLGPDGPSLNRGDVLRTRAMIHAHRGRYGLAQRDYQALMDCAREIGNPKGIGLAWIGLGDMARERREFAEAEAAYHEARAAFVSVGNYLANVIGLFIGLMRVQQNHFSAAVEPVQATRAVMAKLGRVHDTAYCDAVLLVAAGGVGDREGWCRALAAVETYLQTAGLADYDVAWCLERAGELGLVAGAASVVVAAPSADGTAPPPLPADGWRQESRRLLRAAKAQYVRMDRPDDVARVGGKLAAADG